MGTSRERTGANGQWKKTLSAVLAVLMLTSLLAACSTQGGESGPDQRVLRIGTLYGGASDESWFRQQYTDSFELLNPNIEIQIVSAIDWNQQRYQTPEEQQKQPDAYEELSKMLTGDNPVDVVVVEYNYLRRMVQDNLLKQLDPLVTEDKFDLSDYVPTVLDGIKSLGDGGLYALTPTFSSSALFYNKKLISDAGATLPTDGMFWDDIIDLAGKVAKGEGEERIYGLSFNRWSSDGFWDTQTYSAPLQLKMYDDKGEKMTVNTPQWVKVWEDVAELYRNKITPSNMDMQYMWEYREGSTPNPFMGDLFLSGKVAMIVSDYGYISELQQAQDNADRIEGFTMPEWDVVTVPQHQEAPGIGSNVYLSSMMGINSKAQNPDDAWEYLKFLNGKEWAKLKSRSMWELTARKEFLKPIAGMEYNIDAFTTLKPIPPASIEQERLQRERPNLWQVQNLGYPLFQEVLENKKSAQEALAEWETQGNVMLQQIKTNPNGALDPIEGPVAFGIY